MPAFNQVIQVGNMTQDPQLSYTTNQTPVADFGIAVNEKWKGDDGQPKEEVCFIDVRAFGGIAENLVKYTHKGDCILIMGKLAFEKWRAQDGSKHSKHRIIAKSVQYLTPKGSRVEVGAGSPAAGMDIPF
jgi:single-strand DNA-binding protein